MVRAGPLVPPLRPKRRLLLPRLPLLPQPFVRRFRRREPLLRVLQLPLEARRLLRSHMNRRALRRCASSYIIIARSRLRTGQLRAARSKLTGAQRRIPWHDGREPRALATFHLALDPRAEVF